MVLYDSLKIKKFNTFSRMSQYKSYDDKCPYGDDHNEIYEFKRIVNEVMTDPEDPDDYSYYNSELYPLDVTIDVHEIGYHQIGGYPSDPDYEDIDRIKKLKIKVLHSRRWRKTHLKEFINEVLPEITIKEKNDFGCIAIDVNAKVTRVHIENYEESIAHKSLKSVKLFCKARSAHRKKKYNSFVSDDSSNESSDSSYHWYDHDFHSSDFDANSSDVNSHDSDYSQSCHFSKFCITRKIHFGYDGLVCEKCCS